jgi:hypothetical protein
MGFASTLLTAAAVSPLWYGLERFVQFLAEPITKQLSDGPANHVKLTGWCANVTCYVLQCLLWLVYAFGGEDWVFDMGTLGGNDGWVKHLEPVAALDATRQYVLPYYVVYLGYACHSLVKDVRRCWGNFSSPMQAMFLFHHVLTLFLVILSIENRCWRAGVLTRLAHGPADVGVYGGKLVIAAYDKGMVSKRLMGTTYVTVTLLWFYLRCYLYGRVNYALQVMYNAKSSEWGTFQFAVCTALLVGSWVMWLLQVIWAVNLVLPTVRFLRDGDRGYDSIDAGQNVDKEIAAAKQQQLAEEQSTASEEKDEEEKKQQ